LRALVYLVALLTLLPYIALATAFVLLGQAIAGGSLLSFLAALLNDVDWMLPWGFLGYAGTATGIAFLGFARRSRWIGALCLSFIALACMAMLLALPASPVRAGELLFLAPCALVALYGAWLAQSEWPLRRSLSNARTERSERPRQ
jgi:hypothetical protein